jgi:hypothetical protein
MRFATTPFGRVACFLFHGLLHYEYLYNTEYRGFKDGYVGTFFCLKCRLDRQIRISRSVAEIGRRT